MFGGFFSSITSSIRSPKALLAHALARALSEFFDVDPTTIESNLLQDTRIVLHNVQLKPQTHLHYKLVGCVEEIQFSWSWGGNEQTAIVRDARLTINGARFRILLNEQREQAELIGDTEPTSQDNQENRGDDDKIEQDLSYLQRVVQQVVDHLTLVITDFELTIEVSPDTKVVLAATNLGLVSFGRTDASPLSQRISLESFRADIIDGTATLPLIDPIGYAASVKRVSGRRFIGGLVRGLEILGETNEENHGIVLHAGTTQVQVLGQMIDLLLPRNTTGDTTSHTEHPESDLSDTQEKNDDDEFQDARETIEDSSHHDQVATPSPPPSTTFELPLPSVTVLLPNGSKISTPNCTFHYTADGSVCSLEGSQGIQINEEFSFFGLRNEAHWLLDVCDNKVLFTRKQKDKVVADVVWQEDEMKRLLRGFREVLESTPAAILAATERVEDALQETNTSGSEKSTSWSMAIEGSIRLCMQGDNKDWIEAMIDSPSVVLSGSAAASSVNISGITLGPTSFGEATIQVPAITLLPDEQRYSAQGSIEASLESAAVAENVQAFLTRVLDLDAFASNRTSDDVQMRFPFQVHVPRVKLAVAEPEMKVIVDGVNICDSALHCNALQINDGSGMSASVSEADIVFEPHLTVKLRQVSSLHLPGIFDLATPCHDTTLRFVDGTLHVEMESLHVAPAPVKEKGGDEMSAETGVLLPFPIHLNLNEARLSIAPKGANSLIQLSSIDVTASPVGDTIAIESCNTIAVRVVSGTDWLDSTVAPMAAVFSPSPAGYLPNSMNSSGIQVGPSSMGSISVSIPSISLAGTKGADKLLPDEECYSVHGVIEASLESAAVAENVQAFLTRVLDLLANSQISGDSHTRLPFGVLVPRVQLAVADPEMKIAVDGIKIRNSVMDCNALQINDGSGMSASVSGASVVFAPHLTVKLQQVNSVHLPSILDLAKPIHDCTFQFVNGTLHVETESVNVVPASVKAKGRNEPPANTGVVLPFPIQLGLKELRLVSLEARDAMIQLRSIDVIASPVGDTIAIESCNTIAVRVVSGTDWLDSTVAPMAAVFSPSPAGYLPNSMNSSGIQVGPSSMGSISVSIPSISLAGTKGADKLLPDEECYSVHGVIEASLESAAVAENVQAFLTRVLDLLANSQISGDSHTRLPFGVLVPRVQLAVADPEMEVIVDGVNICDSALHWDTVQCNDKSGMSASLSEADIVFEPHLTVKLRQVSSLHLPGIFDLATPCHDTTLRFVNGTLHVETESVNVVPASVKAKGRNEPPANTGVVLPFPIQLGLKELRLVSLEARDAMIQLRSIDVIASPVGDTIAIESCNTIAVRVVSGTDWLDSTVAPMTAVLSPSPVGYLPNSAKCSGIQVGPSSLGSISVNVPRISLTSTNGAVEVDGAVDISILSTAVFEHIQSLSKHVFGLMGSSSETQRDVNSGLFPYPVCIPEARVALTEPALEVKVKTINIHDSSVQCHSIEYRDESGVSSSVSDVSASLGTPMEVAVTTIESLCIPGIASLAEPVSGVSLSYIDGIIQINLSSVDLITPLMGNSVHSEAQKAKSGQEDEFTLPCPVNIRLNELRLWSSIDMNCSIHIQPVDIVAVSPDAAVSIDASGPMTVQVQSSGDEYLRMIVGSSSVVLSPSENGSIIHSLSCSGVEVEPSSSFQISASVPTVSMAGDEKEIKVGGCVNVAVQSFEVLERVQTFFGRYFPPDSSAEPTPFPRIMLPQVKLSIADISSQLVAENVEVKGNEFSCERMIANEDSGMSIALSGMLVTFRPEVTIGIEWIESLYVPGVGSLQKPIQCTTAAFVGETLCLNVGSVNAMSLSASNDSATVQKAKGATTSSVMTVPFPIRVSLKELILDFPVSGGGKTTCLRRIELDIKATEVDPFSTTKAPPGISLYAAVDQVENEMMKLEIMRVTGTIFNGSTDTIHRFAFAMKTAIIVAGFSSVDWSNTCGDQEEKVPLLLPFASIEPFTAHLALEGNVVSTRMTVDVPLFQGDANTNSDGLIQHLTSSILSKAPSIITNSEILGENVFEMSSKTGGRAVLASTVAGSAVGSVGGLVAADSIRGAIASGKKSRNASTDDRYHFGDISRGAVRSVAQAAKTGGKTRRGSDDSYRVGDFTVGASRSACKYTAENKSRLSAATGSGVGMAVGAALGPVGLLGVGAVVAGSYVGSKLGGSVFEEEGEKPAPTDSERVKSTASESKRKNDQARPTAPIGGDEDLLGLNAPVASWEGQSSSRPTVTSGSVYQATSIAPFAAAGGEAGMPGAGVSHYQPPVYLATATAPTAGVGGEADLLGLGASCDQQSAANSPLRVQPHQLPSTSGSHPPVANVASAPSAGARRSASIPPPTVAGRYQTGSYPPTTGHVPASHAVQSSQQQHENKEGYRFGDLTKSVVAKGKRRDGRNEKEGYKFGDFTRGLFG